MTLRRGENDSVTRREAKIKARLHYSHGRFVNFSKNSEMDFFPIYANMGCPFVIFGQKENASNPACIIFKHPDVL